MRALVLTQVRAVRARKVAEATLVRLLPLVQCRDVRLQLGVRGGRVSASVAHVRTFAGMRALVIVLRLVRGEGLVAVLEAACVRTVAGMREEMPRELGALLEVFGGSFATFPLTNTLRTVVDVRGFDVGVEGGRVAEGGETEDARCLLPTADT